MTPGALDPRKNAWLRVLLVGLAMLLVPILAWVLLPAKPSTPHVASASSARPSGPPRPVSSSHVAVGRTLRGLVVDDNGAAVKGALVRFDPVTKESTPRTTTDEDGAFTLDDVPASAGALVASRSGFVSARLDVAEDGDHAGLKLTLGKAQALRGQVIDGEGKGIAGAVVRCDPDGSLVATSGEEGRFELAVGADGCDAQAVHGDYGSSDTVHLTPGGKNIMVLPTPGGIAGIVVDERGLPVTSFVVAVETFAPADKQSEGMGGGQKSVNDPSGAFELTGLGRGRYTLTASAEGRPPTRSDSIEVEAGRTTRGVRIRLEKGITLSGIVTDRGTKQPLAGVRVSLDAMTTTGANAIGPTTTGEDGSFSIDGVPARSFSVRFGRSGYRDRISTIDGRGKSELKLNVDLGAAGDGGNIEMVGIGTTLGQTKDFVNILSVLTDGPADKAGVQAGDKILAIDGKSAEGFTVNDCIQRLRGNEGSTVVVTIGRGERTFDATITRAIVVH